MPHPLAAAFLFAALAAASAVPPAQPSMEPAHLDADDECGDGPEQCALNALQKRGTRGAKPAKANASHAKVGDLVLAHHRQKKSKEPAEGTILAIAAKSVLVAFRDGNIQTVPLDFVANKLEMAKAAQLNSDGPSPLAAGDVVESYYLIGKSKDEFHGEVVAKSGHRLLVAFSNNVVQSIPASFVVKTKPEPAMKKVPVPTPAPENAGFDWGSMDWSQMDWGAMMGGGGGGSFDWGSMFGGGGGGGNASAGGGFDWGSMWGGGGGGNASSGGGFDWGSMWGGGGGGNSAGGGGFDWSNNPWMQR